MQRRGGLARCTVSFGRESGRQSTGFGRETRTIPPSGGVLQAQVHCNRTLHLGNVNVPRSRPASRVARMEEADEPLLAVKRGRPQLHQLLVHFREERNQGRAWSRATARAEEPIISPRGLGTRRCARLQPRSRGGPGKHGRQLWVRFGAGRDTRGVQLRRIFILRGRLPILRCRDRHLILYRRAL